jgi:RNA polymerase sigma-70 factor (ECF subfamily)
MSSRPFTIDFDNMFRQYHRDLGAFALRRLGDREAASDIVQDAFVRYIAYADKIEAPSQPRFLLWRIATNLITDFGRSQRRRGRHSSLDDPGVLELADPAPSPERQLAAREACRILASALDELPRNVQLALMMNRVEHRTHADIAGKLQVSPSMVNKYIIRALGHCAARLHDAGL